MTPFFLVTRELFERKQQLLTSLITILIGVAAIVSINTITQSSQTAIKQELEKLGANVLILPKSASIQSYYAADLQAGEMPETYVAKLSSSGIHGMDNLSPKLSTNIDINGQSFILTGILPVNEIRSKSLWQGASIFASNGLMTTQECIQADIPASDSGSKPISEKRFIESLDKNKVFIGYEAASSLGLSQGSSINVLGSDFTVASVLRPTGTVDDARLFAHLHQVQTLVNKPGLINVIEVVGCCQKIFEGLVPKINALLPDAKVMTIGHVAETQLKTNRMMTNISWVFLCLITLVGGAGIANYMFANVNDRKKEIGTLMAMGAGFGFILRLFFTKALILGIVGGLGGYVIGTILAMVLGPEIANIKVYPLAHLLGTAILISVGIALVASLLPARRAAKIDPCIAFKEI